MLLGFYNCLVFDCGMPVVLIKNDDDDDEYTSAVRIGLKHSLWFNCVVRSSYETFVAGNSLIHTTADHK